MSGFTTSAASRTGPKAAAKWRSERRFRVRGRGRFWHLIPHPSCLCLLSAVRTGGIVPHIIPRDGLYFEESWSEWQDLNLRPPRPERGSGPAEFASAFASELLITG